MPMCDIYIPEGALDAETEKALVKKVSDILVFHEMRRVRDLMTEESELEVSLGRASSIAWMFVHRTDVYVAGEKSELPVYKFVVTIPEGTIDERFAPEINRDIFAAVAEAEGGKYPELSRRIWTHIHEMRDGWWGAGNRPLQLKGIIDYITPGMGDWAVQRHNEEKKDRAVAQLALAQEQADG